MQSSTANERRRPRVDRREAAQILHCSRDNVRRLDRVGTLRTGKRDRNGTFTYDRREVEELARKRGLGVKANGELTARVFRLFKERRSFEDICIETEQEPDVIQALWERYNGGFDFGKKQREEDREARAAREHEEQMRAMDLELERRRRGVVFEDPEADRARPGLAVARDRHVAIAVGAVRR